MTYKHLCPLIKGLKMKTRPIFEEYSLKVTLMMPENYILLVSLPWIPIWSALKILKMGKSGVLAALFAICPFIKDQIIETPYKPHIKSLPLSWVTRKTYLIMLKI